MTDPSRRALLAGAAGVLISATGCTNGQRLDHPDPLPTATLTGRGSLPTSGTTGSAAASPSPTSASPPPLTVTATLRSKVWPGAKIPWRMAAPAAPKALLVSLHGKNNDAQSSVDLGIISRGVQAGLSVLAMSGGNGYWHRRADGRDPGGAVLKELIPLALDASGLAADAPVAFIGWSMGGYGALLLASQMPATQVLAVAPMSAALWTGASSTAPGAFDGSSDYASQDVFSGSRQLPGIPVRMVCGTSDPFIAANRSYVQRRQRTAHEFGPGGHNAAYWRRQVPGQIAFVADQL